MKNGLSEVIFEIRWGNQEPSVNKGKLINSPDYNILLGNFLEEFRGNFTFLNALPTAGMPEGISRGIVQYMLRKKGSESFPLVQLGPGVFTINTNIDNWTDFSKLIIESVDKFNKISKNQTFKNIKINLTYIMAQEFDFEKENLSKFILKKLGIQVTTSKNMNIDEMKSITFQTKIPIEDPVGELMYVVSEGKKKDQKAIVWQCKIQSEVSRILEKNELEKWIESANKIIRKWLLI